MATANTSELPDSIRLLLFNGTRQITFVMIMKDGKIYKNIIN